LLHWQLVTEHFFLVYILLVSLCTVDNKLIDYLIDSVARIASKRWHSPQDADNPLRTTIRRLSARNYDEMSIKFTFATSHEKNFTSYVETVDSRRIERHCVLIWRKNRVATTSLTRDITSADANSTKLLNSRLCRFPRNNIVVAQGVSKTGERWLMSDTVMGNSAILWQPQYVPRLSLAHLRDNLTSGKDSP